MSSNALPTHTDIINNKKNPYASLGLDQSATPDAVKKRYRQLALKFHPDRAKEHEKDAADQAFKVIVAAYYILSDPDQRAKYDASVAEAKQRNNRRSVVVHSNKNANNSNPNHSRHPSYHNPNQPSNDYQRSRRQSQPYHNTHAWDDDPFSVFPSERDPFWSSFNEHHHPAMRSNRNNNNRPQHPMQQQSFMFPGSMFNDDFFHGPGGMMTPPFAAGANGGLGPTGGMGMGMNAFDTPPPFANRDFGPGSGGPGQGIAEAHSMMEDMMERLFGNMTNFSDFDMNNAQSHFEKESIHRTDPQGGLLQGQRNRSQMYMNGDNGSTMMSKVESMSFSYSSTNKGVPQGPGGPGGCSNPDNRRVSMSRGNPLIANGSSGSSSSSINNGKRSSRMGPGDFFGPPATTSTNNFPPYLNQQFPQSASDPFFSDHPSPFIGINDRPRPSAYPQQAPPPPAAIEAAQRKSSQRALPSNYRRHNSHDLVPY